MSYRVPPTKYVDCICIYRTTPTPTPTPGKRSCVGKLGMPNTIAIIIHHQSVGRVHLISIDRAITLDLTTWTPKMIRLAIKAAIAHLNTPIHQLHYHRRPAATPLLAFCLQAFDSAARVPYGAPTYRLTMERLTVSVRTQDSNTTYTCKTRVSS